MTKYKYIKRHNNYDFILGEVYEGYVYSDEWILINGQLYRKECFKATEGQTNERIKGN